MFSSEVKADKDIHMTGFIGECKKIVNRLNNDNFLPIIFNLTIKKNGKYRSVDITNNEKTIYVLGYEIKNYFSSIHRLHKNNLNYDNIKNTIINDYFMISNG